MGEIHSVLSLFCHTIPFSIQNIYPHHHQQDMSLPPSTAYIDATPVDLVLSVVVITLSVSETYQRLDSTLSVVCDMIDCAFKKLHVLSQSPDILSVFRRKSVNNSPDEKIDCKGLEQPAWVSQTRTRLLQALSVLYLLDLSVISYRASHAAALDHRTARSLVSAVLVSFAFRLQSSSPQSETKQWSIQGPHWLTFAPCWIALLGSCVSASPLFSQVATILFAGGDSSPPSSKVMVDNIRKFSFGVTGDVLERLLLGSLALRFGLLCIMALLSVVVLSEILDSSVLQLPASLLMDPLASPPKTNTELGVITSDPSTKADDDKDSTENTRQHGFKSVLRKVVFSLRMTYPSGKRWLEFLYFVKFGIMILGRAIVFYTPMQTERVIRAFGQTGQGKPDWKKKKKS